MSDYTEHLISHAGGDTDPYNDPEGRALVAAIHERKHRANRPPGRNAMSENTVNITVPTIAPMGVEVTPGIVREVWDTFVKPDQDAGNLQSGEMRALMAILRAVYEGLGGK